MLVFRHYYVRDGLLFEDANLPWSPELVRAGLVQLFHSWNPAFGGGMSGIIINSTSFVACVLQAVLALFGVPLSTVLIYPAIMFVAFCGARVLARELGASELGAGALALLFIGNPWFLERVLFGHMAILCAAALVPWLFWAVHRQRRAAHAYGMLAVLLAGAMLQADARIAYLAFAGLIAVALQRLLRAFREGGFASAYASLRSPWVLYAALAPASALLLNVWWTAPFFIIKNVNPVHAFYPPLEDVRETCKDCDLQHAVLLSGTWLHFSWTKMSSFGQIVMALWIAAFAVLGGTSLLFWRNMVPARVLAAAAIVAGIVLSTGTTYVPPEAVYWIYAHVPFAALFRDPSKFGFVAAFGLVVALACAWNTLDRRFSYAVAACCLIVCAPLLIGDFRTPSGAGFQTFVERSHFLKLLSFLRKQEGFGEWRVAVLPPWLAEQSFGPDLWYTANPLVFQMDAPTMDAKLINTGTAMNQSAWRGFDNLYWGIDAHPARTFARLGIRFIVAIDGVTLSPGAALSPYYEADLAPVKAALLGDPSIREVYRDGRYHVYRDEAYVAQIRTATYPLVAGEPSDQVRAALPAGELGDSVAAPERTGVQLAEPVLPFGVSAFDRCLARSDFRKIGAYEFVSHRADWTSFWTASDYTQVGTGDPLLDRTLQRFSLPFAVSRGGGPLDVPFESAQRAHVAVQAAGFTGQTLIRASIDGARPVEWTPSAVAFSWHDAGAVGPGKHVITIAGSKVGTAIKSIALTPGPCAAGGIEVDARGDGAGRTYLVPGPVSWVTPRIPAGTRDVAGASSWDGMPIVSGVPFATLTGRHILARYGPRGANLASRLSLLSGAWRFTVTASPGDRVILSFPRLRSVRAELQDGDRATSIDLDRPGGTELLAGPLSTGELDVESDEPARDADRTAPFRPLARRATLLSSAAVNVRAAAVRAGRVAAPNAHSAAASIPVRFTGDGASLEVGATGQRFMDPQGGRLDRLHLRGVRARRPVQEILTAYYRTGAGDVRILDVADFEAGRIPRDIDVEIPSYPGEVSFALAIRQSSGAAAALTWRAAELAEGPSANAGGYFVRFPAGPAARPARGLSPSQRRFESFEVARPHDGPLVADFSYDSNWSFGSARHFVANGTSNLWDTGDAGIGRYGPQRLYLLLLAANAALWAALIGFTAMLFARARA